MTEQAKRPRGRPRKVQPEPQKQERNPVIVASEPARPAVCPGCGGLHSHFRTSIPMPEYAGYQMRSARYQCACCPQAFAVNECRHDGSWVAFKVLREMGKV